MRLTRLRECAFQLGLCALLFVSTAFGRKNSRTDEEGQNILRVTTHLVQVNVIVKNGRGQLVGGLSRDDFKVFDNGRPQTISIFRVEETKAAPAPQAKLPPGVYSNLPERQAGSSPAVTVILLDGLNTQWADQASARMQVVKFLRQLEPGDPVALYTLGTELRVLHDFTTDSSALVAALARYRGRVASELQASEPDQSDTDSASALALSDASNMGGRGAAEAAALAQWMSDTNNLEAEYYTTQRVRMTVDALVAIADHVEGLPGRKNLIWVSGGFPILTGLDQMLEPGGMSNVRSYGAEISRAAQALNNVNLAIYPVDARGLMVDPGYSAARRTIPNRISTTLTDNFAAMDELAKRTGGRAFYNTNDLQGAIRRVVDDSRLTYVLGYYPEDDRWNGEFRKIKVVVDRPGLKLQYRNGYAAVPQEPSLPPGAAPAGQNPLDTAVFSPLDATGVGFAALAAPEKSTPRNPETARIHFRIDPWDITLTPEGSSMTASLTIVMVEFSAKGQNLKGITQRVSFKVTPQNRNKFLATGFNYSVPFAIVPQAERIRVVVRDNPTGAVGSINIPLDGPAAAPKR